MDWQLLAASCLVVAFAAAFGAVGALLSRILRELSSASTATQSLALSIVELRGDVRAQRAEIHGEVTSLCQRMEALERNRST